MQIWLFRVSRIGPPGWLEAQRSRGGRGYGQATILMRSAATAWRQRCTDQPRRATGPGMVGWGRGSRVVLGTRLEPGRCTTRRSCGAGADQAGLRQADAFTGPVGRRLAGQFGAVVAVQHGGVAAHRGEAIELADEQVGRDLSPHGVVCNGYAGSQSSSSALMTTGHVGAEVSATEKWLPSTSSRRASWPAARAAAT
jgi:hypothetical protein